MLLLLVFQTLNRHQVFCQKWSTTRKSGLNGFIASYCSNKDNSELSCILSHMTCMQLLFVCLLHHAHGCMDLCMGVPSEQVKCKGTELIIFLQKNEIWSHFLLQKKSVKILFGKFNKCFNSDMQTSKSNTSFDYRAALKRLRTELKKMLQQFNLMS